MTIGSILKQKKNEIYSVKGISKLCDAIDEMNNKNVGALLVKDKKDNISGIISERDIITKACSKHINTDETEVNDVMTAIDKLIIGTVNDTISYAMHVMTNKKIRHLPIYDNEKLVGLISIGDVLKKVMDENEAEVRILKEYIKNPYGVNTP